MARKRTANKEAKPEVTEKPKVSKPKSIDWDSLGSSVTIVGVKGRHLTPGKEYTISTETAKILVGKGVAKLK